MARTFEVLMFGTVLLPEHLEAYFSQFGEIIQVHPYFVPDTTHNSGTYITFTSVKSLDKEHLIECIRVQTSEHFGLIPPVKTSIIPRRKTISALKVSMKNGKLRNKQLFDIFSEYGELKEPWPEVRGSKPFYAIINFKCADNAKKACMAKHKTYTDTVQLLARLWEPKRTRPPIASPRAAPVETEYPDTWQLQKDDCQLFEVRQLERPEEWDKVAGLFQETMGHVENISIKRVQNKELWEAYARTKQKMIAEGKPLNEKSLFHGTGETASKLIFAKGSKGFDFRYSSKDALWGRGAYFAVKASYSNEYSYKSNGERQIFLVCVLVGRYCFMQNSDVRLIMPPPLKPDSTECYDSVKANSGGSDIFVVYDFGQTYPAYLITY